MGTWGPGPFDNDSAGDMIAKLIHRVRKPLNMKSNHAASYYYEEGRAAAKVIVLASNTDILGGPSIDDCIALLKRMLADEEWLNGWRNPFEIAAAIKKDIHAARLAIRRKGKLQVLERKTKTATSKGHAS